MATFQLTVDDNLVKFVTAARDAYNAALPLDPEQAVEDHPDFKATNDDYIQFVAERAVASYAVQYPDAV